MEEELRVVDQYVNINARRSPQNKKEWAMKTCKGSANIRQTVGGHQDNHHGGKVSKWLVRIDKKKNGRNKFKKVSWKGQSLHGT